MSFMRQYKIILYRPHMTIWPMCIEYCIPKATNTQSEYVTLISFPLQQWLSERALMLCYTYITCLVISEIVCSLWGMIWGGEIVDHIFSSITDCNVEWGGTHRKIPLTICGWWSVVSLFLICVHVNQCFSENDSKIYQSNRKNIARARIVNPSNAGLNPICRCTHTYICA